jgi:hypothetical protein
MRTVLLLLLFIGAFLVMDGAHRDALAAAVSDAEARGRGATRYKVADGGDILELQFAPRSNQFGSLFDSNGPWSYRGAAEPFNASASKETLETGSGYRRSGRGTRRRKAPGENVASGETRSEWAGGGPTGTRGKWYGAEQSATPAVEGFSGAGGGRPSFIDGLGDPSHARPNARQH